MIGPDKRPSIPPQVLDAMDSVQGKLTCQKCGGVISDDSMEYGNGYVSSGLQWKVSVHKCGDPEKDREEALERCKERLQAFKRENPHSTFDDQMRAYKSFLADEKL
jgi:hypothetical protein